MFAAAAAAAARTGGLKQHPPHKALLLLPQLRQRQRQRQRQLSLFLRQRQISALARTSIAAANRGYATTSTTTSVSVGSDCPPDIPVARSGGEAQVKLTVAATATVKKKTRTVVRKDTGVGKSSVGKKKEKVDAATSTTVITESTLKVKTTTSPSKKSSRKGKPLLHKTDLSLDNTILPPSNMASSSQYSPSQYTSYVNIVLLRKLPWKIKTLSHTERLALAGHFDLEPFFTQSGQKQWEIYKDVDGNGKLVLLVPLKQAYAFLDHVYRETGIEVPKHPKSNYCYKKKEVKAGEVAKEPVRVATVGTKLQWEAVQEKWGLAGGGGGGGMTPEEKEAKKKRQQERREASMRGFGLQVERARKLLRLGSGGKNEGVVLQDWEGENGGVRITDAGFQKVDTGTSKSAEIVDVPYFVCVDCESYERNHNAITEIGIATLDMADLPSTSHTASYAALLPLMKYRHIRIREHRYLRNGRFVPDAADLFDFGTTEFWGLAGLPTVLAEVFTPPPLPPLAPTVRRSIAFIGHDAPADIKYLSECKFDARAFARETLARLDAAACEGDSTWNVQREMEVFDTAEMYKALTGDANTRGLGKMAVELGLDPRNLHNAGNDAGFTLRGFVRMCEEGALGGEEGGSGGGVVR